MTTTMIRTPAKGRNDLSHREAEDITGYPPADGLLADMLMTRDPAALEVLARKVATAIGRASAGDGGRPIISQTGINVAASRSGVPFRGGFASELFDLSDEAMRQRRDECSAQAIERVKARIDFCKANNPGNFGALKHCLDYAVEDDLGRYSDADYEAAIPSLVAYAGFEDERAEALIRHLQTLGRIGRDDRETQARLAYQAEFAARAACRRERKQAGFTSFATYAINQATGRAVEDEAFEASEIARAEAEHVAAVTTATASMLADATRKAAPLGSIIMVVFEAACQTRSCPVDGEGMIAEFVVAGGDPRLAAVFERTIAAAWDCAGPAETEAAFTRLLAAEGISAPFDFAGDDSAVPVEARPTIEASSGRIEPPQPLAAVANDDADDRATVRRVLAKIRSNRDLSEFDLLAMARRLGCAALSVAVETLTDEMIDASRQMTEYMHDAIRLSIIEARHAGGLDDAGTERRVQRMLRAIHAPITGEPGLKERNAGVVATAMSPIGATEPTPFVWADPHRLPRRPWLYGTLYIRKELTATIAPGGVGKTALTIVEALALASGQDLLGTMPRKRCKVWIWSGEEPLDELQKRILAACEHHGLSAADLTGWLFVDNFESFDFIIAEQTRDGTTIFQPKVDILIRYLVNLGIDILFIDPAISTHNVGENDNVAIQKWATGWKSVAVGANASISIAHHAKKLGGQAATADDSRGARSFVDKCRIVRSLAPMSGSDAEAFQIPVEDRRYFFFTDPTDSKSNMSPAVGGRDWFRSHSVVLGKGQFGNCDPGEAVGVVDQWTPPKSSDRLDGEKVDAIREAVGDRRWRAANNMFKEDDSIGAPIARGLGLDPKSPSDMRRIRAAYAKLIKERHVIEEKVPDKDGKPRPFARWSDDD